MTKTIFFRLFIFIAFFAVQDRSFAQDAPHKYRKELKEQTKAEKSAEVGERYKAGDRYQQESNPIRFERAIEHKKELIPVPPGAIYVFNPFDVPIKITVVIAEKPLTIEIQPLGYSAVNNLNSNVIISCSGKNNYWTGSIEANHLYDLMQTDSKECYRMVPSSRLTFKK